MTPPIQLNRLDLNLDFYMETIEVKQILYTRIMKGLVNFSGSRLEYLKLRQVDLQIFLAST